MSLRPHSRQRGSRHATSKRRRREPMAQKHPTWADLLARIDYGFSPKKEASKRILAEEVPDEDASPEEFEAYEQVVMLLGLEDLK